MAISSILKAILMYWKKLNIQKTGVKSTGFSLCLRTLKTQANAHTLDACFSK